MNARDLLSASETTAARQGVFHEQVLEHCTTADVPHLSIEHARLHDLTIIPVRDGENVEQWYAEAVIFGSGRPTMILPETPRRERAPSLDTVAVAWDFNRPAARAVADALPLLERAKRVRVVTVTNEKTIGSTRSGAELAKHLARHGVEIVGATLRLKGGASARCWRPMWPPRMPTSWSWALSGTRGSARSFSAAQPRASWPALPSRCSCHIRSTSAGGKRVLSRAAEACRYEHLPPG